VSNPQDINGRVSFKAEEEKDQFIVNEKGEKVGGVHKYVSLPHNINGTIAFWAREGAKYFIVNEKGEMSSKGYDEIYCLGSLPAGRAYVIAKEGHAFKKEVVTDLLFADGHP